MGHEQETELTEERRRHNNITGSDLPNADGQVSDGDAQLRNEREGKPTGQDHSTEDHAETIPDDGVGAVQDSSDTTSDVARIRD